MPAMSWVHKLLFPARELRVASGPAETVPARSDLSSIRYEMLLAVQRCGDAHRNRAAERIRHAASPMDLWSLRTELYLYLARDVGQCEANARINALMPLFKGWVPEALSGAPKHNGVDGHPLH
jgi:hypothetical protein